MFTSIIKAWQFKLIIYGGENMAGKGKNLSYQAIQAIRKMKANGMTYAEIEVKTKLSSATISKYLKTRTSAQEEIIKLMESIDNLKQEIAILRESTLKQNPSKIQAPKPEPSEQKQDIELLNFSDDPDDENFTAKELTKRLYREDGSHPPHDAVEDAWNFLYGTDEKRPYGKYPLSKFLTALEAYNKKPRTRVMNYKAPKPA